MGSPARSSTMACCGSPEAEKVVALFRGHYNIPLVHVDASE